MIVISKRGARKLSELEIDTNKDWEGYKISNISGLSYINSFNFEVGALNLNISGISTQISILGDTINWMTNGNVEFGSSYGHTTRVYGTLDIGCFVAQVSCQKKM